MGEWGEINGKSYGDGKNWEIQRQRRITEKCKRDSLICSWAVRFFSLYSLFYSFWSSDYGIFSFLKRDMVRETEFAILKTKYTLVEKGCTWGSSFTFGMPRWNWLFLGCKDDGSHAPLHLDESATFKTCFSGERINTHRNVLTLVALKRSMVFCWNLAVGS